MREKNRCVLCKIHRSIDGENICIACKDRENRLEKEVFSLRTQLATEKAKNERLSELVNGFLNCYLPISDHYGNTYGYEWNNAFLIQAAKKAKEAAEEKL